MTPASATGAPNADCCIAKPVITVTFDFGELSFCQHHWEQHDEMIFINPAMKTMKLIS